MSYNNGPKIVTSGLVLYLDAGNSKSYPGSGSKWYDLSGFNNTFTLVNNPTFSSDNGGSLNFNGSSAAGGNNQYAISDNNFTVPSSTLSIQFFVKRNAVTSANFPAVFFCGNNGDFTANAGVGLLASSNNDNFYSAYYGGASGVNTLGAIETNNNIVHIAMTFDNNRIAYRNGVVANQAGVVYQQTVSHSGLAYIGLWSAFGRYINSKIYTLSIYNRSLRANEILQNYNALKSRFNL